MLRCLALPFSEREFCQFISEQAAAYGPLVSQWRAETNGIVHDQLGEKLDAFKKERDARIKAFLVDRWLVTVGSINQVVLFHDIDVGGIFPCPDLNASFIALFPEDHKALLATKKVGQRAR